MLDMPRIGLFGGTFDPPHLGHLIIAQCAYAQLALDQVVFVPAANPPHKQDLQISAADHRLAMVALAIANNPAFALSRLDTDRPGPHYTVDLLHLFGQQHPADLYFLMGGDSLRDLLSWRNPAEILALAHLAVVQRPNAAFDLATLSQALPQLPARCTLVAAPQIDISASTIRAATQNPQGLRYLVPDSVLAYIAAHKLYR
jgi:nicotinate-nucleotide adenylyltransferase